MSPGENVTDALRVWGWTDQREAAYAASEAVRPPARITAQHRGEYELKAPWGDAIGVAPGRMQYRATGSREMPAVGDWVLVEPAGDGPATIVEILERSSAFVRRRAGTEGAEQVVAANVDVAFLVSSMNLELNPRRLERYLVAARDSGAMPVILLTKLDLVADPGPVIASVEAIASGAPVVAVSSESGEGLDEVRRWLEPGTTGVLLGSSGVGKSTLVNTLAGQQLLTTRGVRLADDKGRHTTTHREIFMLPDGAMLLDTPGMREMGLVDADDGLDETFDDVSAIVGSCRFRDCTHQNEPGCAVRSALDAGDVTAERWGAYEKLQRELASEVRRRDLGAAQAEKKKWKKIHQDLRKTPKKGR